MDQSHTLPSSVPPVAPRHKGWHERVQLSYYLLAIAAILAGFVAWVVAHAAAIVEWLRTHAAMLEAGPAGDVIRSGGWIVTFVISFALIAGTLLAAKAAWSFLRQAEKALQRVVLANEQGFHVADVFCQVLMRLADAAAEARSVPHGPNGKWDALELFLREEKPSLILLLNQIARFFTLYTGRECCASLKLFQKKNGKWTHVIYTPVRDDQAPSRKRQIVDERFPFYDYRDNTAFDVIVNDPARRWFVENDLLGEERRGRYANSRKGWQHDYTATLVVPITDQYAASAIDKHNVIGFLCVDNKGGGFDERFCANVTFAFARLTYGILKTFA